ncbi:uncharacterized protein LOC114289759 [Camellia sinensis]|uniref:uncharacterized protein LOC114289759 n=1 Tax=Camellia sinensis TaxID=4442 RepID=UPI0010358136|nr:uncharacterized protein LOC114289759 [Camellia sinensis]
MNPYTHASALGFSHYGTTSTTAAAAMSSSGRRRRRLTNTVPISSAEKVIGDDDLLRQILLRLPAKPLLKFKLVSKTWCSLISDPFVLANWIPPISASSFFSSQDFSPSSRIIKFNHISHSLGSFGLAHIVPVYRSYMQNYGPLVEQDASGSKYAKYTAQSLEKMLSSLLYSSKISQGSDRNEPPLISNQNNKKYNTTSQN